MKLNLSDNLILNLSRYVAAFIIWVFGLVTGMGLATVLRLPQF